MNYTVIWHEDAFRALRRLHSEDSDGVVELLRAIRDLASDPAPPTSRALGGNPIRRLRLGRFRVLYEVDDESLCVTVVLVGALQ